MLLFYSLLQLSMQIQRGHALKPTTNNNNNAAYAEVTTTATVKTQTEMNII